MHDYGGPIGRDESDAKCDRDGHMILLHGFTKKNQKTPAADIALALKRKKEVT